VKVDNMDKSSDANKWSWLPARMPRVADLIRAKRAELGKEFVDECWKRGVVQREPGWFFAWEAGLGVGAPWPEALAAVKDVDPAGEFPDKAFVVLRPKEVSHGAH
jgi:hypothetical protein